MSGLQLTLLTALNMLGSGIIMIPAKIAAVGTESVLAWVATGILAVCMAYVFANCGIFSSHRGGLGGMAQSLARFRFGPAFFECQGFPQTLPKVVG